VAHYFANAKNLPPASYYNKTGRAYPDLSAISDGYTVVCNLIPMPGVAGTSCSTPVVSAVFSLINDLRFQHGLPPMGFLNPFIYQVRVLESYVWSLISVPCCVYRLLRRPVRSLM